MTQNQPTALNQQRQQQQQQQQQQLEEDGPPPSSARMMQNQPTALNQRHHQQQQLEEDVLPLTLTPQTLRNQPTARNQVVVAHEILRQSKSETIHFDEQEREQREKQPEDDPPGHPNNPIGSKRAKKIVALERQIAETRAQMAKILDFQSKTLQECISAATASATGSIFRRFQNIRSDIVQTVS